LVEIRPQICWVCSYSAPATTNSTKSVLGVVQQLHQPTLAARMMARLVWVLLVAHQVNRMHTRHRHPVGRLALLTSPFPHPASELATSCVVPRCLLQLETLQCSLPQSTRLSQTGCTAHGLAIRPLNVVLARSSR
jgi:hypothetical protein